MAAILVREFPSSSGSKVYTARINAGGVASCDCLGWTMKRGGQDRSCKHTREMLGQAGARVAVPASKASAPAASPLNPMLASAMVDGRTFSDFENSAWALEPKIDGHRCIVSKRGDNVHAWSRPRAGSNGVGLSRPLPDGIAQAVRQMPDGVYDGELVAPSGKAWDVTRLELQDALSLMLFDAVEILGADLLTLSYTDRRAALTLAVQHVVGAGAARVQLVPSLPVSKAALDTIYGAGGEGAILKRRASTYRHGWRSPDWIKCKATMAVACTVTGFEAGKMGPQSKLVIRTDDGIETTVKVLGNAMLRDVAAAPQTFIGRRLVISCQERIEGQKPRHGIFDHWAGESE